jgi:PAS domain S-box-containing protein
MGKDNSLRVDTPEERLAASGRALAETQRLVHELKVRQFELEMQNEELRRIRDEKQEMETLLGEYSDLYDLAPVGYFMLGKDGVIRESNSTGAEILRSVPTLVRNRRLDSFVARESRPAVADLLVRVFAGESKETCQVVLRHEKEPPVFLQIKAVAGESREECRAVVIDITGRKRAENEHERLAAIVLSSLDAIISKDLNGTILNWNAGAQQLFGFTSEEAVGKPFSCLVPSELRGEDDGILQRLLTGEKVDHYETVCLSKDARRIDVSVTVSPVRIAGRVVGVSKIIRDITERKRSETYREMGREILQVLNETLDLQESLQQVVSILRQRAAFDAVGLRLLEQEDFPYFSQSGFANDFLQAENSLVRHDAAGQICRDKDGKQSLECACGMVVSGKADPAHPLFTPGGSFWTNDAASLREFPPGVDPRPRPRKSCTGGYASLALVPIRSNDRIVGLVQLNDRSKGRFSLETLELLEGIASHIGGALMRKKAEAEKIKLEIQLLHAQKMESVGRLAGGVAHDFNNMLGVIIGHANLVLMDLEPGHPVQVNMGEIRKAAERSADLTRQLLAFARKQTVAPKVIDLNEAVDAIFLMLKRLIGEHIDLTWRPGAGLWPVRIDPSQIDQILANLCVNARDSIGEVGKISIETRNSSIDEGYCAQNAVFVPGEYVCLAVSDNGHGMDKETQAHIFEPFFTTKSVGEGTGLGLSTVYGAAKQNNGFINVYSEPGVGTTLTLYLPRYQGLPDAPRETPGARSSVGEETILLVEDEPAILEVAAEILIRQGYRVLAASSPEEALRLAGQCGGAIALLLTDVVMPGMNGRELAKRLQSLYPHLKRLFMSGYTSDIIAHHGVLDEGVHFIQKPFTLAGLAAKVREVLDTP